MKNIEWLKKEVSTEMIRLEPHRAEKWSDVKYQTLRDVAQKLDQLEEPEVLSQEWVDNNSVYASHDGVTEEYVHVDDLQSLLVPTISEIETVDITEGQIMDWLDDNDFFHHATAETVLANAVDKGELGYYGTKYSVVKKPEVLSQEWISENKKYTGVHDIGYYIPVDKLYGKIVPKQEELEPTIKVLIEAYKQEEGAHGELENGWISGFIKDLKNLVEEEPLYYALVKGHELTDSIKVYWVHDKINGDMFIGVLHSPSVYFLSEMSKSEWNELGINDSNADFVEVAE